MKVVLSFALAWCITGAIAAPDPGFTQAVQEYHAGRWSSAYARFMLLANSGNIEAARIALFMQRHGKLLYNSDWFASEEDLELWSKMTGTRPPNEPDRVASDAAAKGPAYRPRITRFIGRGDQRESR